MPRSSKPRPEPVDPAVWRTVGAVLVGGLAVLFDTTIVAVALRTLSVQLHAPVSTIQWVSTAYLLALGVTVPVAGWAQRWLGGRRLWLLALALFLVGSVLCSLAWDATSLIGFRVVQGIGGGLLVPLMSSLVMQAAGGHQLGRVMSVVSLPAVLGPILGPVLGGLILQHLHWSWMFWVNVPFCVAGLLLGLRWLPADGARRPLPFDVVGFALLAPGLVGVLWGLSDLDRAGGPGRSDALLPLAAGVLLLVAFVVAALRRRHRSLVDLRLLRHRALASSSLLLFLSGLTLYGAMVLLPLWAQEVRGLSVLGAGLLLIPQGFGTLVSRSLSGRLSDVVDARWLALIGFVVVLLGTVPFVAAGPTTALWLTALALFVRGVGLGTVTVPLMALGFRGLSRDEVPDASVITRIAQQVGGSFGTAVLALILTSATASTGAVAPVAQAFRVAFWWAVGFSALGAVVSLALPGRPPAESEPPAAPSPVGMAASRRG